MKGRIQEVRAEFGRKFSEFWPVYLRAHSTKWCRILHYVGTVMGVIGVLLYLLTGEPWLIISAVFCGYGFAWTGHYVFEENSPLTFKHPVLSLCADFVMFRRAVDGRLGDDLRQAGAAPA